MHFQPQIAHSHLINTPDEYVCDEYESFGQTAERFGLCEVGYTEYMEIDYYFGFQLDIFSDLLGNTYPEKYKDNLFKFDPNDMVLLDPIRAMERAALQIKQAELKWKALLEQVKPTDLLWSYLTDETGDRTPKLLQLTLSS